MARTLTAAIATLLLTSPAIGSDLEALRNRIEQTLELTQRRYLVVGRHTPWQIFHGILAFGQDFTIRLPDGQLVNAVQYVCQQASVNGERLFVPTEYGLDVLETSTTEGHPNQFLAIFAVSGLPIDHPIIVGNLQYQIHHLVTQAQYDYYEGQESSWTLIALSTYLPPDSRWRNKYNQVVSIRAIAEREVELSPEYAPCGGTHNLYALAHALQQVRAKQPELLNEAPWTAAKEKLRRYVELTKQYQMSDGSFSTEFYRYAASSTAPEDIMYATGHTLEWLAAYLPPEELQSRWVVSAVERLLEAFDSTSDRGVKCGPLYHAAHGLRLYYDKLWGRTPEKQPELTAGH